MNAGDPLRPLATTSLSKIDLSAVFICSTFRSTANDHCQIPIFPLRMCSTPEKGKKKRPRGKKGGETPRPQEGRLQTRNNASDTFRIRITLSNEHSPVQPDNAACKSPATKTASSAGVSGPPPTGGSSVSETYASSFRCTSLRDRQSPLTRAAIICSMLFQKNLLFFRFFLKSAKNQCTLPS